MCVVWRSYPHFRKRVNAKVEVPILEQGPTCLCAWEELDGASKAGHAGVGVLVCPGQWWQPWWIEKREIKHFRKLLPNCSRQRISKNNKPKPNRRYLHLRDLSLAILCSPRCLSLLSPRNKMFLCLSFLLCSLFSDWSVESFSLIF